VTVQVIVEVVLMELRASPQSRVFTSPRQQPTPTTTHYGYSPALGVSGMKKIGPESINIQRKGGYDYL
jgi:hypothetical protein